MYQDYDIFYYNQKAEPIKVSVAFPTNIDLEQIMEIMETIGIVYMIRSGDKIIYSGSVQEMDLIG